MLQCLQFVDCSIVARKNNYKYPFLIEDVHISKSDLHVYMLRGRQQAGTI